MAKGNKISDPRFARVHNDPRFNIPKRKDIKGEIDVRFRKVLEEDADFQDEISVDKYGRKVKKDSKKELRRYADMSTEAEKGLEEVQSSEKKSENNSKDSDEGSEGDSASESEKVIDRARGIGISDESSESESESEDSEDEYSEVEEITIPEQTDLKYGDETARFAVVNLDWDNIRSVDLMVTFSSFASTVGGRILSVRILPSEFGKQKMAQEEVSGPDRSSFKDVEPSVGTTEIENQDEEYSSTSLRKYQIQRLQYYYAVIECDSVKTAKHVYDNCDGSEYEATANFFDLRYVPDDMDFDDEPRDSCTKVPANYQPNAFVTDALQHSKVKLTWDETPKERLKLASKAFSQKEIDDMDFKAYLASDSESETEAVDASKYKSLVGDFKFSKDKDMEITFTPALDGGVSTADFPDNADSEFEEDGDDSKALAINTKVESTAEAYVRKQKDRKKSRMEKIKQQKMAAKESGEDKRKRAELELLVMDETDGSKPNRKSKKDLEEADAEAIAANLKDERFADLYENPEFAIDTTAPQYKPTKAMEKIMKERRKRMDKTPEAKPGKDKSKSKTKEKRKAEDDTDKLVAKLKKKNKH